MLTLKEVLKRKPRCQHAEQNKLNLGTSWRVTCLNPKCGVQWYELVVVAA